MAALRRFVLHGIEMVVAMMVGMMLFAPVWDLLWPRLIGAMLLRFDTYTHAHRWRMPIQRGRRPVITPAPVAFEGPASIAPDRLYSRRTS